MSDTVAPFRFQELIEKIEALSLDDQELLIGIVRQHLIQRRRAELAEDVAEVREAYRKGDVHRGSIAQLMGMLSV